nr:hypothetical protein BaRGS_014427 [Batillaria attramentaria]
MSYTTYPQNTLPPELVMGVYNCSPPYIVPEEFQCDGIAQCLAAEDELDYNCSYTHLGCDEGWIAGESFCLKFVFPTTLISPDQAGMECWVTYNADLGSLLHPGVRRLAASLISKTNHSEVIVGLERAQAGHLYRFLWSWTQAGTEFDGPQNGRRIHYTMTCDGYDDCGDMTDEMDCNDMGSSPVMTSSFMCRNQSELVDKSYRYMFDPADHLHVRYLDLSGSFQPPLETLHYMGFLHFLNLSSCSLSSVALDSLIFLRVLDLSFNNFTSLISLGDKPLLTHLNISSNPLLGQIDAAFCEFLVKSKTVFLQSLDLSKTGIEYIQDKVFMNMSSILHLNIRGNEIPSVSRDMFSGLSKLKILETDDPRLCCPYFFLYGDETMDCRTPIDELSSCNDLLRSDFFRAFLWTLSAMAISGNIGVLIYRMLLETQGSSSGFRVLVANLCVADFLMGVYLTIIGAADSHYSGEYIWKQEAWTQSNFCQAAGFLALLSSEVSAFLICLITLDRLLVLQFPLHRHLHLTARSAMIACGAAWFVGVVLAAVPLMPAEWTFYGQTGICLPLPITRKPFLGQHYAFGVFVILNFLLFVLIGAGQLFIYHAVRTTPMASRSNRRKQDMAIARRLFLIVFTDFCCWFPIGLIGLLVSHDTPIPGEVNVWAAIFILPVNSAINPFLYTLSMLAERWLKRREEKRVEKTLARLHADMNTWSDAKLQELLTHCQQILSRLRGVATRQRKQTPLLVMREDGRSTPALESLQIEDCNASHQPQNHDDNPAFSFTFPRC